MSAWDGSYKAPKGSLRVIGEDTFSWPHEEYWIGDFDDADNAAKAVKKELESKAFITIFDSEGKVFSTIGA